MNITPLLIRTDTLRVMRYFPFAKRVGCLLIGFIESAVGRISLRFICLFGSANVTGSIPERAKFNIFCVQSEFACLGAQRSMLQFQIGPNLIFHGYRVNFLVWARKGLWPNSTTCQIEYFLCTEWNFLVLHRRGPRFKSTTCQIRACEPRSRSVRLKVSFQIVGEFLSYSLGSAHTRPIGLLYPR